MITLIRTIAYPSGKGDHVLALARQSKRLLHKRFGVDLRLQAPVGGAPNRIAYVLTFRNLAEMDDATLRIAADPDYRKLVAAHAGNVIDGSIHDEIWREIETPGP